MNFKDTNYKAKLKSNLDKLKQKKKKTWACINTV